MMVKLACLLLLPLVCTACTVWRQSPPICQEIATLRPLIGHTLSSDSLKEWAVDNYRLPANQVVVRTLVAGKTQQIHWETEVPLGLRTYWGIVLDQGVVTAVEVFTVRGSLATLSSCVGVPDQYYARYLYAHLEGANVLALYLVFPEQGIFVLGTESYHQRPKQPPPFSGDFPIEFLWIRPSAPIDEFLQKLPGEWSHLDFVPWPGSWEDMKIDIDPNTQ